MSLTLLYFAKSFVNERLSPLVFTEGYMELWKIESQTGLGLLSKDDPDLNECLSSIFCVSDMYCEDETIRDEYELDETQLREQVAALIARIKV